MQLVKTNEATAAERIMVFPLMVDATNGLTAEVGESGGQSQYSIDGGQNWINTNGTLVGGTNGAYQTQLIQAEVNQAAGVTVLGRFKSANTAEARAVPIQIVAFDPADAAALGLSNVDQSLSTTESNIRGADSDDLKAISDQLDGLSITGTNVIQVADANSTVTTGTPTGSYTDTQTLNSTYHEVQAAGNIIDFYYEMDIGANRQPVESTIYGRFEEQGAPYNDVLDVYAYNWGDVGWDHISPLSGDWTHNTSDETKVFQLNPNHVGTGGDVGKVRVRIEGSSLDATSTMYVDYIFVAHQSVITVAEIADGVWDEILSAHTDAGSAGKTVADILEDTGTTIPALLGTPVALDSGSADLAGMLKKMADDNDGASFDAELHSLMALRGRGDAAWITATGFSTHNAAAVWAVGTRTLTAFGFQVTPADGSITAAKFGAGAITANVLAANAITAAKIAANAFTAAKFADDAISADAVATAAADKIAVQILAADWASYEATCKTGSAVGDALAIIRAATAGASTGAGADKTHRNVADDDDVFTRTIGADYETRTAPV